MNAYLLVGLGGAIGAVCRYGVYRLIGVTGFPVATLAVNIAGSFLMGVLAALLAHHTPEWSAEARLFLATGVLGGFTTFSAFSLDTIALLERGQFWLAAAYVAASVCVSIGALALGFAIARGGL